MDVWEGSTTLYWLKDLWYLQEKNWAESHQFSTLSLILPVQKLKKVNCMYDPQKQYPHLTSAWLNLVELREILVTVDFSENYSFILKDVAQGFHWNNSQATLHPFVAYFVDRELRHLNYVIISDCLHHDTIAVYLFQKCFIAFLKSFSIKNCSLKK